MLHTVVVIVCAHASNDVNHLTALSSDEWRCISPPSNLVSGHVSTMCNIVWTSPHWHPSSSASLHIFQQARQCPWAVRNRFSRDHSRLGRSNPGRRIVGSVTRDDTIVIYSNWRKISREFLIVNRSLYKVENDAVALYRSSLIFQLVKTGVSSCTDLLPQTGLSRPTICYKVSPKTIPV